MYKEKSRKGSIPQGLNPSNCIAPKYEEPFQVLAALAQSVHTSQLRVRALHPEKPNHTLCLAAVSLLDTLLDAARKVRRRFDASPVTAQCAHALVGIFSRLAVYRDQTDRFVSAYAQLHAELLAICQSVSLFKPEDFKEAFGRLYGYRTGGALCTLSWDIFALSSGMHAISAAISTATFFYEGVPGLRARRHQNGHIAPQWIRGQGGRPLIYWESRELSEKEATGTEPSPILACLLEPSDGTRAPELNAIYRQIDQAISSFGDVGVTLIIDISIEGSRQKSGRTKVEDILGQYQRYLIDGTLRIFLVKSLQKMSALISQRLMAGMLMTVGRPIVERSPGAIGSLEKSCRYRNAARKKNAGIVDAELQLAILFARLPLLEPALLSKAQRNRDLFATMFGGVCSGEGGSHTQEPEASVFQTFQDCNIRSGPDHSTLADALGTTLDWGVTSPSPVTSASMISVNQDQTRGYPEASERIRLSAGQEPERRVTETCYGPGVVQKLRAHYPKESINFPALMNELRRRAHCALDLDNDSEKATIGPPPLQKSTLELIGDIPKHLKAWAAPALASLVWTMHGYCNISSEHCETYLRIVESLLEDEYFYAVTPEMRSTLALIWLQRHVEWTLDEHHPQSVSHMRTQMRPAEGTSLGIRRLGYIPRFLLCEFVYVFEKKFKRTLPSTVEHAVVSRLLRGLTHALQKRLFDKLRGQGCNHFLESCDQYEKICEQNL
ncbi:MAG: hypothetical protein AAF355_06860 [Myxococcota bacterium]